MDAAIVLEAMTSTPSGGVTPRCQEIVQRTGKQCARPARKGHEVCSKHGAGTAPQEESGTYTPVSRPSLHGLYSKRPSSVTLSELTEEVYQTEDALTNSDRDLAALKGTSWALKNKIEAQQSQTEVLENALGKIESILAYRDSEKGEISLDDALEIARALRGSERILATFEGLMRALADVQFKTISAHKVRAETEAKLAEAQAIETFGRLCVALRPILSETIADRDVYEALAARIRREVLGPVRLELPATHF